MVVAVQHVHPPAVHRLPGLDVPWSLPRVAAPPGPSRAPAGPTPPAPSGPRSHRPARPRPGRARPAGHRRAVPPWAAVSHGAQPRGEHAAGLGMASPELARMRRFGAPGRGRRRRPVQLLGGPLRQRAGAGGRGGLGLLPALAGDLAGGLSIRSTNWRDAEIRASLSRAMPAKPSRPPTATRTPPPTIRLRLSSMAPWSCPASSSPLPSRCRPDHDARPRGAGHHTYRVISDVVVEVELRDTYRPVLLGPVQPSSDR